MQSDQGQPQNPTNSTSIGGVQTAPNAPVKAENIGAGVADLLKQVGLTPIPTFQPPAANIPQRPSGMPVPTPVPVAEVAATQPQMLSGEPKIEFKIPEAPKPAVQPDADDLPPDPLEGKHATREDFIKLKSKVKENKQVNKQLLEEKTTLEKKLKDYETGAALPEVVQEQEAKIARLSRYEKLLNFKQSDEAQEKFIKPLAALEEKLYAYGADYSVPKEVMGEALKLTKESELNSFLEENFGAVGALEIKQTIRSVQSLQKEYQAAEAEPAKALEAIRTEQTQLKEIKEQKRKNVISEKSKNSWESALNRIYAEGEVDELIMKENAPEHNEKIVKPILTQAATEFGKIVVELAKLGITDLPEELGSALARMTQLAHVSGTAIQARKAALQYASELEKSLGNSARYNRPAVGMPNSPSTAKQPETRTQFQTGKDAARELLSKVM